jgi:hypothetical protein
MQRIMQIAPVVLAAFTCALFMLAVDYAAGPRMAVLDILADDLSILDVSSGSFALWAVTLPLACVCAARAQPWRQRLFVASTVFGLGAAANETFGLFDAARMLGPSALSADFVLYELRLVSALAFLTLTLVGIAVQLALTVDDEIAQQRGAAEI